MVIKDDKSTTYVSDVWTVQSVTISETKGYSRRAKVHWSLNIQFSGDAEVYLKYKKKADAQKVYDRVVKRIKKEKE